MEPQQESPMAELKRVQEQLHFYRGYLFAVGEFLRGKTPQELMRVGEEGMRKELARAEAIRIMVK